MTRFDLGVTAMGLSPHRRRARSKLFELQVVRDVPARLSMRCETTSGDRLDQHITQNGRFHRPGYYLQSSGIRSGLIEVVVLAAASYYLYALELLLRQH